MKLFQRPIAPATLTAIGLLSVILSVFLYVHFLHERLATEANAIEAVVPAQPAPAVLSIYSDQLRSEEGRGYRAKPGEVTTHGKGILYWFYAGTGAVPVALKSDYGFLVVNESAVGAKKPRLLFILAAKNRPTATFASLKDFQRALGRLPHGVKLYRYDRCTTSASKGLSTSVWRQIRKTCRKAQLRLVNQNKPYLTCICSPINAAEE